MLSQSKVKMGILAFAVSALAGQAIAQDALRRGGDRRGPDFGFEETLDNERFVERLNRQVRNETLPLRRLLDIGAEYRGYAIKRVVIVSDQAGRRAQATLVGNRGEVLADAPVVSHGRTVLQPRGEVVIGEDVRRLALRIDGRAFINRLIVVLEEEDDGGYYPPGHSDEVVLEKTFPRRRPLLLAGSTQILPLVGASRAQSGLTAKGIEVVLSGEGFPKSAWLRVNGGSIQPIYRIAPGVNTYYMPLPQGLVLGYNLHALSMDVDGPVTMSSVSVIFQDERNDRPGRGNRGRIR